MSIQHTDTSDFPTANKSSSSAASATLLSAQDESLPQPFNLPGFGDEDNADNDDDDAQYDHGSQNDEDHGGHYDEDDEESMSEVESSPVSSLPPEVLVHIFAYLDPASMLIAAQVSRTWSALLSDDSTWKQAFTRSAAASGAFYSSSKFSPAKVVPTFRRVARASFRAEALARARTYRLWRKSRVSSVTTSPRMGPLNDVAIAWQHRFMLGLSLVYGVAVRSDPVSGKLMRGLLQALPPPGPGLVPGHLIRQQPNAAVMADAHDADNMQTYVTHVIADADGGRIVWGLANGVVRVTSLSRQGSHPRGLVRTNSAPIAPHGGMVTTVSLPLSLSHQMVRAGSYSPARSADARSNYLARVGDAGMAFASGAADGSVRLWGWGEHRPQFLWAGSVPQLLLQSARKQTRPSEESGEEENSNVFNDPTTSTGSTEQFLSQSNAIDAIDFDPAAGAMVAATSSGVVALWWGFNLPTSFADTEAGPSGFRAQPQHTVVLHPPRAHTTSVARVAVDASSETTHQIAALVQMDGDNGFFKIEVRLPPESRKDQVPNDPSVNSTHKDDCIQVRWWRFNATSSPFATLKSGVDVRGALTTVRADFDVRPSPAPPLRGGVGGGVTLAKGGALGGVATALASEDRHLVIPEKRFDAFAEHKFVVAGTERGALLVWGWDDERGSDDPSTMQSYAPDDLDSWSLAPIGSVSMENFNIHATVSGGEREAAFALPVSPASAANPAEAHMSPPPRPASPSLSDLSDLDSEPPGSVPPAAHQATGSGDPDAVTSIDVSGYMLAAGTADGMIRVYDSLSGGLLRTFADRAAGRSARGVLTPWEFASRFEVKQVLLSGSDLAAVVGHQVLAWRPASATAKPQGPAKGSKRSRPCPRIPGDDADAYVPMGPQQAARAQRQAAAQRRWGAQQADEWEEWPEEAFEEAQELGLGDEEALAYALLLSQEQSAPASQCAQTPAPQLHAESSGADFPPLPAHPGTGEVDGFEEELRRAMELSTKEQKAQAEARRAAEAQQATAQSRGPTNTLLPHQPQTEEEELAAALRAVELMEAKEGKGKAPAAPAAPASPPPESNQWSSMEREAEHSAEHVAEQAVETSALDDGEYAAPQWDEGAFPDLGQTIQVQPKRGKQRGKQGQKNRKNGRSGAPSGPSPEKQRAARAAAQDMGMNWDEMEDELRLAIYESLGL